MGHLGRWNASQQGLSDFKETAAVFTEGRLAHQQNHHENERKGVTVVSKTSSINKQFEHLKHFIGLLRSIKPEMSSDEIKAEFLEGLNRIIDPKPVGWRGTGFTEDAFQTFWEIAWNESHKQN